MKTFHLRNRSYQVLVLLPVISALVIFSTAAVKKTYAQSEAKPIINLFNDTASASAENIPPIDPTNANLPAEVKGESEVIAAQLLTQDLVVTDHEISKDARITENDDGTTAVEYFNLNNKRTEKLLRNEEDRLLERWIFDPAQKGRITHYEKYAYADGSLESYRVAAWKYGDEKAFLKTNRMFDSAGKQTKSFTEYAGANGKKFREEWFDAEGKPSAVKSWDPESGEFQGHILVKDYPLGMKRVEWAGEDRKTVRKELVRNVDMKSFEDTLAPMKPKDNYRSMRRRDAIDRKPPIY